MLWSPVEFSAFPCGHNKMSNKLTSFRHCAETVSAQNLRTRSRVISIFIFPRFSSEAFRFETSTNVSTKRFVRKKNWPSRKLNMTHETANNRETLFDLRLCTTRRKTNRRFFVLYPTKILSRDWSTVLNRIGVDVCFSIFFNIISYFTRKKIAITIPLCTVVCIGLWPSRL